MTHKLNSGNRLLLATLILGVACTTRIRAQPQPAVPLAFEVASVKLNTSGDNRRIGMQFLPGGRFTATNVPLFLIVATAYNVPFQSPRLSGGPDFVRSDRYDIEARAEAGAIPSGTPAKVRDDKMRLMLQALLADRFKMTIRREMKELPVYAIVVSKGGPKLPRAKLEEKDCPESPASFADSCHSFGGGQGQGLHGSAVDISDLAVFVSNWTDRPVVDESGLKGLFNIQSDGWVPLRPRPAPAPGVEPTAEDLAFADPARPTLFMVFDRLGLKLESQRAPVEMFVIEHAEKPSGN
jgi:uncharacterized protein (TIGR03435 family)